MKVTQLKEILASNEGMKFLLPDGSSVPSHFHITEFGKIDKDFIDCGGKIRKSSVASLQLWQSVDYHHRLSSSKMLSIITLSQDKLGVDGELEIEVEYQGTTIEKYGLDFDGKDLKLTILQTDCLALDSCGIPGAKIVEKVAATTSQCCTPGGGCC